MQHVKPTLTLKALLSVNRWSDVCTTLCIIMICSLKLALCSDSSVCTSSTFLLKLRLKRKTVLQQKNKLCSNKSASHFCSSN